MVMGFFEAKEAMEGLKKLLEPTAGDRDKLLAMARNDVAVERVFYEDNSNEKWLPLLKDAGEFEDVLQAERDEEGGVRYKAWAQSKYLAAIAGRTPERVLEIIREFDTDNLFVIKDCMLALQAMEARVAVGGMGLVRRLLGKDVHHEWHFVGKEAAKLMVKFAEQGYEEEAFKIAEQLLLVTVKEDEYFGGWHDLVGPFDSDEYGELVFTHLRLLWEREGQGLRAGRMLVELLDRQIEAERKGKEKESEGEEWDPSEHSYIPMPSIAKLEKGARDTAEVIVVGICRIGRHLIEKEAKASEEFIALLRSKNRVIFRRVEMYLLRFVPAGNHWDNRVTAMIRDVERFDAVWWKKEYQSLLHDKWDVIDEDVTKAYISWAKGQKVKDEDEWKKWFAEVNRKDATAEDIKECNNLLRAKALYCIRDKESALYKKYLEASGRTEEGVRPRAAVEVGMAEWAEGPEHSPLKPEEMLKLTPREVIERVRKCDEKLPVDAGETPWERDNQRGALANVFRQDVIERADEYLQVGLDVIAGMSGGFAGKFFYGLDEAINSKKLENPEWERILEIAGVFLEKKGPTDEYGAVFETIPRILERGFRMEAGGLPVREDVLDVVWDILTGLLEHVDETDVDDDGDPLSGCINCVQGLAFENIIRFGLFCRKNDASLFARQYAGPFRDTLQHVMDEIEKLKIRCVFGVFFNNLCWLDEKWVAENLDRIFAEEDDRRWDAIWGSYVYWSSATELGFRLARRKYEHAIGRLGVKKRFEYGEEADKKLGEHLMLAYWQGWDGVDGLLDQFLRKAGDELLGGACHFLWSGLKHLKEHERDEWREGVESRLLAYWERRHAAIRETPSEHQEEAREFARWVKDSPFEQRITLDIAEKAVELTGGMVGKRRGVTDFIEGLCEIVADGQELAVLKLLRKVMDDPDMSMSFSLCEEKIVSLMDRIVKLVKENGEMDDVRRVAMDIADTFGRLELNVHVFRGYYDELKGCVE